MTVRAVTSRVPCARCHVQTWRDADGIDRFKDEWATGEDIYDPYYLPPARHGRAFRPLADLDKSSPRVGATNSPGAGEPSEQSGDGQLGSGGRPRSALSSSCGAPTTPPPRKDPQAS